MSLIIQDRETLENLEIIRNKTVNNNVDWNKNYYSKGRTFYNYN